MVLGNWCLARTVPYRANIVAPMCRSTGGRPCRTSSPCCRRRGVFLDGCDCQGTFLPDPPLWWRDLRRWRREGFVARGAASWWPEAPKHHPFVLLSHVVGFFPSSLLFFSPFLPLRPVCARRVPPVCAPSASPFLFLLFFLFPFPLPVVPKKVRCVLPGRRNKATKSRMQMSA